jgi:hypothetical protein
LVDGRILFSELVPVYILCCYTARRFRLLHVPALRWIHWYDHFMSYEFFLRLKACHEEGLPNHHTCPTSHSGYKNTVAALIHRRYEANAPDGAYLPAPS